MKRFQALWRDTWWLWTGLVVVGLALGFLVEWIFFLTVPISFFAFVYFGLMRYDSEGNQVPDRFGGSE